jgi:chromate transporter
MRIEKSESGVVLGYDNESYPVALIMMKPKLSDLAREFLLMGLVSFGAGMYSLIYQRVVIQRSWMGEEEFREGVIFSELAPGPFTLHLCMYIGYHLRGLSGLLTATSAFSLPSIVLVVLIAFLRRRFLGEIPGMEMFIVGVWAAILAMMLSTILSLGRHVFRDPLLLFLAAGAFALSYFLDIGFIFLILGGGSIYLAVMSWRGAKTLRGDP